MIVNMSPGAKAAPRTTLPKKTKPHQTDIRVLTWRIIGRPQLSRHRERHNEPRRLTTESHKFSLRTNTHKRLFVAPGRKSQLAFFLKRITRFYHIWNVACSWTLRLLPAVSASPDLAPFSFKCEVWTINSTAVLLNFKIFLRIRTVESVYCMQRARISP